MVEKKNEIADLVFGRISSSIIGVSLDYKATRLAVHIQSAVLEFIGDEVGSQKGHVALFAIETLAVPELVFDHQVSVATVT